MTYRVYFNRCEDSPQIWSVDQGTIASEVNVIGFRFGPGVHVRDGRVDDFAAVTDRKREPVAWMAVDAVSLRIVDNGVAYFSMDSDA